MRKVHKVIVRHDKPPKWDGWNLNFIREVTCETFIPNKRWLWESSDLEVTCKRCLKIMEVK